jgi:20S proteasome subunit alpha 6
LQGKSDVVLATLHRTQSELSSTLNKVFKIDDHMGIAVSGVAADGRIMCNFMRTECLNHKHDSFLFPLSLVLHNILLS